MLMLAKCYAVGHWTDKNVERAEALISEAAVKGNNEAVYLKGVIDDMKKNNKVDMEGLLRIQHSQFWCLFSYHLLDAVNMSQKSAMEKAVFVMSVVPLKTINFTCQFFRKQ